MYEEVSVTNLSQSICSERQPQGGDVTDVRSVGASQIMGSLPKALPWALIVPPFGVKSPCEHYCPLAAMLRCASVLSLFRCLGARCAYEIKSLMTSPSLIVALSKRPLWLNRVR